MGVSCPEIAKELLSAGADVNWRDPNGTTPLLKAVAIGGGEQDSLTVVKVLVAAGADVNARDVQGTRALELARRTGQNQIAEFLKERSTL
jgi:ankyrin repeat protein